MSIRLAAAAAALVLAACATAPEALHYPATRRVDQVDVYHGQPVADPYRWLEDDNAPETAAWVTAQNQVTDAYFARLPVLQALRQRLTALYDHPRDTVPERRGEWLYYRTNSGLQNQSVVVRQKGLDGAPETVIDPNALSPDGTTRLLDFKVQPSGRYAAYALSNAGSDWLEVRVLDLDQHRTLPERLQWVKVTELAWHGDGFFYSRYPAPPAGQALSSRNEDHQVYFHRLGTPQSEDTLAYRDAAHPQRFHQVQTSSDGRWAVLSISERGQGRQGNALFVRDLAGADPAFRPLVPEIGDASFDFIDTADGRMLVKTDDAAPNGKVISIDPRAPARGNWRTVVPEQTSALQSVTAAGGRLFVTRLVDVASQVEVRALDGHVERQLQLPSLGAVEGFEGRPDDAAVFYSFESFGVPPTIYRYDIASGRSSVFRAPVVPGYDPAAYETRQVFFTSQDGTRVPMFLVHRRGLVLDGRNPTLLVGYGGFNISYTPSFSALKLALLERGFVYAVANLRGGGEYGEAWHQAGTQLKKQNVFDDFIAAAEWLIAQRITSPDRLAIQGGSNGGLLVGAVINQRPDLFAAAVPQVGVMDMLRFQKFTIGWNWVPDYGSSDDAGQFRALYAYSPLHNIRPGARYPAVLITTADHDDRVVPAHSFKYAAALQAAAAPGRPVLIRIDTRSGHGASNTAKRIESTAEVDAFLIHELHMAVH